MCKILSIGIILMTLTTCQDANQANCDKEAISQHVNNLKTATARLNSDQNSDEALESFFQALPDSFECFNAVFGYESEPAPFYFEPQLYDLFPKMELVVYPQAYIRKLVTLAINGRWAPDQIGALQATVHTAIKKNPVEFTNELEALSELQEASVWRFIFDGPHPSNLALTTTVLDQICSTSARSCHLHRKIFDTAVSLEIPH